MKCLSDYYTTQYLYAICYHGAENSMENKELIIAISPHKISDQDFTVKNRPIKWVYFGKNYLSKIKFKNGLTENFSELDISRLLEEVANEIRSEHVTWIDKINHKYGGELEWWFGNVASRNIYQSDVFQYCCYLVLLERLWEQQTKKPALIVVDSPGLASAIHHWAQDKKVPVSFHGRHRFYTKKCSNSARFFLRWVDFIIITITRKIASAVLNKDNVIKRSQSCDIVMVSTFVHASSISDSGTFYDRYLPQMKEYLEKNNKIVIIHPVFHGFHYNFFTIFKKISRSSDEFVIQENYLKLRDYLHAWIYPIRFLRQNLVIPEFHGFDVKDIVHEDQTNADVQNVLQAILTFRLMQLLGMKGLKLHSFIDWYENQTLNRAIVAGVHNAFPGVKTIGAQMFLHYPNFLSLSPSRSETNAGVVPDILLTTSRYQCELARAFDPNLKCIPAAALRYAHVFTQEVPNAAIRDSSNRSVLVLTSFNQDETIELLQMIQEIKKHLAINVTIYIRFHPDIRTDEIIKLYPGLQNNGCCTIFHGSLAEGIRDASAVIANGSSSMIEAVAKGTPAIFVGNQNKLNLNPLSGMSTPLFTECYSGDEVSAALLTYLNLSDSERRENRDLGKSIRDIFFLPVNDETLAPFLSS